MMLARVADSLYWVGRYVERAEHLSRLSAVMLNATLDRTEAGAQAAELARASIGDPQSASLADPFDPNQAIPASARLLRTLRQHFGNLGYAAAAYNAGSHRVGQWLDHHRALPRETRNYVRRVTGRSVETWRKSPPGDSALTFVRPLPCRDLPAFAGLEQAQPVDPQQTKDTLEEEKAAPRIGKRITRRIAARFAARFAQRRATATPAATTGVVVPAMIARNVHGGPRDAMRRPQHAPHERRRLAQALSAAPIP